MPHYIIYFNQQWVGDHPEEWFRERGPLANGVVAEIEAAISVGTRHRKPSSVTRRSATSSAVRSPESTSTRHLTKRQSCHGDAARPPRSVRRHARGRDPGGRPATRAPAHR
ncbi:hypothetical protein CGZ91_12790 [Parenemella sanctibonifatiensis]|uniref:Uncharacterized protein n=1 Tax=Parenemella sanctibonifatiensis TaxID=2016505 RepID=A0A255EC37_9ACTN|nr:hypothetical protein CGZ91_12790 [Parenemella sanctibonifatiensis]